MARLERQLRRRIAGERGFTLIELLISSMLGLLVIGAGVSIFASALKSEPRARERAESIQDARVMADGLARELRQGSNVTTLSPADLAVLTYVPHAACGSSTVGAATRCKVFYSCAANGSCTRTECGPNALAVGAGCGPTVTVVTGLASNQVFEFTPRIPGMAFVSFDLAFPSSNGNDAITIADGVALRNPPLGAS